MSFALLLPKLTLGTEQVVNLAPGFTLRRAKGAEIDKLREFVGDSRCFGSLLRAYLEGDLDRSVEPARHIRHERSKWAYNVVEFTGDENDLRILQYALDLLPWGFVLAITIRDNGGCAWHLPQLTNYTLGLFWNYEPTLPAIWLRILRSAFDVLSKLPADGPQLRPFAVFDELKHLPGHTDAHALGLFAVLEMVLTHKPHESKNLHDSLRHQVSTKMPLLSKRFPKNELPLTFPEYNAAEIWKTLYDWRSAIAHGESYDFTRGKLRRLVSRAQAHGFLEINVRFLLKASLDEPELIADLKVC